jgi:membrane protease YdiL (CAAX protease family)
VVQGILFGLAHVAAAATRRQNVALMVSLACTGVVLGTLTYVTKRIGPAMWAHGLFNTVAAVAILAQRDW